MSTDHTAFAEIGARLPYDQSCGYCGTIHRIESLPGEREYDKCTRCGNPLAEHHVLERKRMRSHFWALMGLLVSGPALLVPMLYMVEPLSGRETSAGLIKGVVTLFEHGDVLIGLIIGLCSGLLPVLKLFFMWRITRPKAVHAPHGRLFHFLVKSTEKLGMAEVFVAGLMIVAFKLSQLMQVELKPGLYLFLTMVAFNFLATWYFDSHVFRAPNQYGAKEQNDD